MEQNNTDRQPNDYEIKKQQKLQEQEASLRKKKVRKFIKAALIFVIIAGPIGALSWYAATRPKTPESEIISRKGLHWHPELSIEAAGQRVEIPANLGIGVTHNPIHTHDTSGTLHLEMQGLVRRENLKLKEFFKVWGKDIESFGSNMRMTVNGQDNVEFGDYEMKDGDKIELKFD